MNGPKKIKNLIFLFVKIMVFAITVFYLIKTFRDKGQALNFRDALAVMDHRSFFYLVSVILLMFLNWSLESFKWKLLVSKLEKKTFFNSFRGVLSGQAFNNWVPFGIAEYAGRLMYVSADNRKKAIYAAFLGSWAKFIISFGLGSIALLLFYNPQKLFFLYNFLVVGIFLFLIFSYFNSNIFLSILGKFRFIRKIKKTHSLYGVADLRKNLLLSFFRYSIYIVQYSLVIRAFHIGIDTYPLILGVTSIFFIQSFLPAFAITEIGIRGAVIILLFGKMFPDYNLLIFSSFTLWIINVILPSIFGLYYILTFKRRQSP